MLVQTAIDFVLPVFQFSVQDEDATHSLNAPSAHPNQPVGI